MATYDNKFNYVKKATCVSKATITFEDELIKIITNSPSAGVWTITAKTQKLYLVPIQDTDNNLIEINNGQTYTYGIGVAIFVS